MNPFSKKKQFSKKKLLYTERVDKPSVDSESINMSIYTLLGIGESGNPTVAVLKAIEEAAQSTDTNIQK